MGDEELHQREVRRDPARATATGARGAKRGGTESIAEVPDEAAGCAPACPRNAFRRRSTLGVVLQLPPTEGSEVILLAAIFLTQMFTSDIHDKDGQRIGTIKENPSGGYDFYDKNYNRRGYGRVSPYDPGVIELFDSKGSRLGTIRRPTGQDRKR